MATNVKMRFRLVFGDIGPEPWIYKTVVFYGDAEKAYILANRFHLPYEVFPVLVERLNNSSNDITEEEISEEVYRIVHYIGNKNIEPVELNQLVGSRDEYALIYLNLENLTEEELDKWDANNLDHLPKYCEVVENFEYKCIVNVAWTMDLEFVEHTVNDIITREEADQLMKELEGNLLVDIVALREHLDNCARPHNAPDPHAIKHEAFEDPIETSKTDTAINEAENENTDDGVLMSAREALPALQEKHFG